MVVDSYAVRRYRQIFERYVDLHPYDASSNLWNGNE